MYQTYLLLFYQLDTKLCRASTFSTREMFGVAAISSFNYSTVVLVDIPAVLMNNDRFYGMRKLYGTIGSLEQTNVRYFRGAHGNALLRGIYCELICAPIQYELSCLAFLILLCIRALPHISEYFLFRTEGRTEVHS